MAGIVSPNIVEDGLILCLDVSNSKSYISGSTIWNDLTRNQYTGSLVGIPGYSGNNGGSIVFDGINDYIIIPNTGGVSYTFDCWYKMGGNDGTYGYFASSGNNGLAISEGATAGGISMGQFYYWNGVSSALLGFIPSITNWNHICAVILTASNNIKLYANSKLISDETVTSLSTSITNIGRYVTNNTHFLFGNMASYKIYNRVLSSQEIIQNYNALKTRYGLT